MIKKISILILSMIIIVSCSKNNPNNPNNGGNGDGGTTPTENKYDTLFLKFKTDKDTVPTFNFFKDTGKADVIDETTGDIITVDYIRSWNSGNVSKNEFIYEAPYGESTNTGGLGPIVLELPIQNLKIYVYRGINPFETSSRNDTEKQFYFYKYDGLVFGVPINNNLVAVDTKTGLIFPYAVPEYWNQVSGNWAPTGWISAELGKTGKYGTTDQQETFTAYKFWQYDPIGKVNDDGTVTLEQFYTDGLRAHDYKPRYTGSSPYKDIQ